MYLKVSNLYSYAIPNFFQTDAIKWKDPKEFNSNKYNINNQNSSGYT